MNRLNHAWNFQSHTNLLITLLICVLIHPVLGLDTSDPNQAFVGTWQAQFQGKTFLTLKLEETNGKLIGTISHAQIELDNQGDLTSAVSEAGDDPITEAKVDGQVLHLTSKAEGEDATQYQLELSGTEQAELRFVKMPSNATPPKPWKLQKQGLATRPLTMKEKLANAAQIWMAGQTGTSPSTAGASAASTSSSAASSSTANALPALKISDTPLDADLQKALEALPRRVNDRANNLGDMVNFVIVGSDDQLKSSLDSANWHVADTDSKEAALKAVLQTYQKKDYLAMPMSQLYLFGRIQDFGYEQAEPYAVVASRHHFRVWKAPFTWNGQTVWVGAGTHDVGFEKDQRNGSVTHKIDPAVDGERENIGAGLQKADKIKTMGYYLPQNPVQTAKNATGGEYHSDGRILVILLK